MQFPGFLTTETFRRPGDVALFEYEGCVTRFDRMVFRQDPSISHQRHCSSTSAVVNSITNAGLTAI